jgi:4-diphosphocytidyl-2-C-methyl-D-erythritol kinase
MTGLDPAPVAAPAKLNLCLYLGPPRDDGLHELCSLLEPLSLADLIRAEPSERDEVLCPEVEGDNLAAAALAAMRERGWEAPPQRIAIRKRIPIAAGLGGGSADAAAVLRLGADRVDGLAELARALGADVPSQLEPGFALVRGAGELVEPLPPPGTHAVVLIPQQEGLETARVYAEADRLGLGRTAAELDSAAGRIRDAVRPGTSPLDYASLLVNDLEPAAVSLMPGVAGALEALRDAGAAFATVAGSGPTAFGLFADAEAAQAARGRLGRDEAIVATPWRGEVEVRG